MCRPLATSILSHPIFIVSSFLGIFPFRSINGVLESDILLFCYSVTVAAIFFLMGFFSFSIERDIIEHVGSVPLTTLQLVMFLHIFQYPCCLIFILLKRKLLLETINLIQHLKFRIYKTKLNYWNSYMPIFFEFLNFIGPIVFCVILFCKASDMSWNSILPILFLYFLLFGSSLCISQYCFLLSIVYELFEAEITILRSLKRTVYRKRNMKMMEQIIETINEITAVAKNIDCIYSFQNLYLISARYLLIIIAMYFIIEGISTNLWLGFGNFVMMMCHFYNCWKICHASELTTKKVGEYLFVRLYIKI